MAEAVKYLELLLLEEKLTNETKELIQQLLYSCPPEKDKVLELKESILASIKSLSYLAEVIEEDVKEVEDFYKSVEAEGII